jgi:hypothetical protein
MDIIEFFIYGIFFIILFIVFRNEFMNIDEEFTSYFYKNNNNNNNSNTTCDSCKQGLWYPFNPEEYYGYWGFKPYKGLWGHINPWWYYPYPYPTPIDYHSCPTSLNDT